MNETQTRIIAYLKQHHTATAKDLSLALSSTPANIRHHLLILQANGVVEICDHQPPAGRGHPVYLYRLNPQAYQNNLAGLSHALLQLLGKKEVDGVMLHLLAGELAESLPEINGNLMQRLSQTVTALKGMSYEPRWEARRDGPRFMFANCPYAVVLADHPELCKMDVFFLEKLLGRSISQTAQIGKGTPGSRFCIFALLEP